MAAVQTPTTIKLDDIEDLADQRLKIESHLSDQSQKPSFTNFQVKDMEGARLLIGASFEIESPKRYRPLVESILPRALDKLRPQIIEAFLAELRQVTTLAMVEKQRQIDEILKSFNQLKSSLSGDTIKKQEETKSKKTLKDKLDMLG